MTTRVVFSSKAKRDALEILELIANEAGEAAAIGYARKFEDIFDRLATYPEAYSVRPSLGARIRVAAARPYLVLYRYDEPTRTATVLRLLHGRREITADFMKMR